MSDSLPNIDILMDEVSQHYPDEPIDAMRYLVNTYIIDSMLATHLISVIWSTLHQRYPMNLPNFLVNPYAIHKN